jgi:uncharacterized membrane protein
VSDDPTPTPPTDGSTPEADLYAFAFDHPLLAQEALLAAMRLQARTFLALDDAAIVHREADGRVRIVQTKDVTAAQGALTGSWWGLIAGLFVPGGPLIGAALGAAVGGLFGKLRDIGIDDDHMKRMGDDLSPGESALFLLVKDCHQARALHEISRFPGRLIYATGPEDVVEQIRDRLAVDPWDAAAW